MSKTKEIPVRAMPAINMREVVRLADFQAEPYLVLSLYVNADARTQDVHTIRSRAHSLLHEAHLDLEQRWTTLEHAVREAARRDLEWGRAFFDTFLPRGAYRGVAFFSCAGHDMGQYFPLPRPVSDRYAWDSEPLILPAARLVEDYPRTGVILLDRERGRYFGSRLGEVEELKRILDDVPGKVREGGLQDLVERRIERHIEDHVHRHLKHVAEEARATFQSWPIARLLVGGNHELFEAFRRLLLADLRDRWSKELELEADAPLERVQDTVLAADQELERKREDELLQQLYDAWRSGGYGVVGIPETLRALYFDEVQTLVVDSDLRQPGYRCRSCGALLETGGPCPICQSRDLRACPDLADEAIEDALARKGSVEIVSGHDEFRNDGGLGGLLRFRPQTSGDAAQEGR